jgi:dTMP kinase
MSGAAAERGRFLVLEGIDGCGKTTQLEALRGWLKASGVMPPGVDLVVTREPGGTPLGAELRRLLLHPPADSRPAAITELLLYAADRAQHVRQRILPALEAGHWVLCDRYVGSTAAYQGHGRGLPQAIIHQLEQAATAGLDADLTLWLDLPPAVAAQRRRHRPADRIEAGGHAFLERVAEGFARLAAERGWQRIDAAAPTGQVTADCRERIVRCLGMSSPADG